MKLEDIVKTLGMKAEAAQESLDREVRGGYASDLLSDVMANSREGDVWVTLQVHPNIIAVATLKDLAGIIIVQGKKPEEETIKKAQQEGVPLLVSDLQAFEIIGKLYRKIARKGVKIVSSPTVAEFEKLAEGVYRDVNIALANELAILASKMDIDYDEMAEVSNSQPFCHLHKPGIGVGGACIPVYPIFLMSVAKNQGVNMDLTSVARRINSYMPIYTAQLALQISSKLGLKSVKVTILGLAFRGGIDDTRFSPTYDLINALIKGGIEEITVNDPYVHNDPLLEDLGFRLTNKIDEALKDADIVIVATDHPEYKEITLQKLKDMTCKERIGVVDSRHIIEDWRAPPNGVIYVGIGRPFRANVSDY